MGLILYHCDVLADLAMEGQESRQHRKRNMQVPVEQVSVFYTVHLQLCKDGELTVVLKSYV